MKCIILKYSLATVWMKVLLDAAKTSLLCRRQLCLQEHQGSEKNDKGLLVGRPVAPRPNDEYVGLSLAWLDVETSAGARLELWGVSEMIQMHWDDTSDKAIKLLGLRLRLR